MRPITHLSFGVLRASGVFPAWTGEFGQKSTATEPKSSYDNRSRDFPHLFEEDDVGDITFGR